MAIKLKVPSIVCDDCVESITREIKTEEPNADVKVDVENKTVTVETKASEESVRQMITAVGHTVE